MTTPSLPLAVAIADSNLRNRCDAYADIVATNISSPRPIFIAQAIALSYLLDAAARRSNIPHPFPAADYDALVLAAIHYDALLRLPLSLARSTVDAAAGLRNAAIAFHRRPRLTVTP